MDAININELINAPLAGCLPFTKSPGAYTTLIDGLFIRLAIIHGKRVSTYILDQINIEGEKIIIFKKEYVINELLYEIRIGTAGYEKESFETPIINQWAAKLMEQMNEDAVLEFISKLKQFRARRNRSK